MSAPAPQTPPYSLLILAGGQGRRMQGRDKGLIDWRGQPLIAHICAVMAGDAGEVLISCNRNIERYARYGLTICDSLPDFPGPLAGLLSGLEAANNPQVLLLPCDNPQPPSDLYQRLSAASASSGIRFAYDGERDQYLYALINRSELASLRDYLASGRRSVKGWYAERGAVAVGFDDQQANFSNINRQENLGE